MNVKTRLVPFNPDLIDAYQDYFDLSIIRNRDKRVELLTNFFRDKIYFVSSINSYSDFIRERSAASENFIKNATLSEVTYLRHKGNLENLSSARPILRDSYACYWAFDYKLKDLPLITKASLELKETLKKCGEESSFDDLLISRKKSLEEGENDIVPKITAMERVEDKVENRAKFFTLIRFFDEVTLAEGYERHTQNKDMFFPYILYGLELEKTLTDNKRLTTRNPLEWLRPDLQQHVSNV